MAQATHRLTGVDVRYISLAGRPKNGRSMVLKADGDGEVVVMRETQIALTPGRDFGRAGTEAWMRLSFASSMADLIEAVARLSAFLAANR